MKGEEDLGSEDLGDRELPPGEPSEETPPGSGTEEETPSPKDDSVEGLRSQLKAMQNGMMEFQASMQAQLSQAQNDAAYYRGLATRNKEQDSEEPQEPDIDEKDYYANPVEAARKIARDEFRKEFDRARQQGVAVRVNELRKSYDRGRDRAIKMYPKLFQGIERPSEDMVFEAIRTNRITDPRDVESEQIWLTAAEAIRRSQGELDFTKYYRSRPPSPQSEPFSETPSGARQGQRGSEAVFDEEADDFLRAMNKGEDKPITKQEIAEAMKRRTVPQRRSR